MSPKVRMVGMAVAEMARSLAFYRRLGLEIPPEADSLAHVEHGVDGITLFWDSSFVPALDPDREPPAGGYPILIEFSLGGRDAIDAMFADLTGQGYRGHRAPFDTAFGAYMAMVDDADGNTVLLSAEEPAAGAVG